MTSVSRPEPIENAGTELVREWAPDGKPGCVVVLVHGIAEHSGRYERTGDLLAEAGYFVRSFDLIGFGGTGGRRGYVEEWGDYHDQIERHMEWARHQGTPVVLMGHSMGGLLALGYVLSGHQPAPDLLVLSAPALGGGASWQKSLSSVAAKLAPSVPIPNGLKGGQLSRDPKVGEDYFSDPLVYAKTTPKLADAMFNEMVTVSAGAKELSIPTLVLHGGADQIVPPQSTAILGELPVVERRLVPNLQHEILNEPEGPDLVAEIVDWIGARI